MANKNILKKAKKAVERYVCKVQPLSKAEKDELKMRVQIAIQKYNQALQWIFFRLIISCK